MQEKPRKYTLDPRPPRLGPLPFWLTAVIAIATVATWIPLSLIARGRFSYSEEPRVSYVQDMGTQPKYREQQSSDVFADTRAARMPIVGTVPRGRLQADDHYYRGYSLVSGGAATQPTVKWFDTFPDQVQVTPALLARGKERFNIYCSACHGYDGSGHGVVNDRAMEMNEIGDTSTGKAQPPMLAKWTQAADLRSDLVKGRAVGHIYNTINVGIRNMPGYGPQVPVEDRWAIVAYVRAIQLSQTLPATQPTVGAQ
jgi:mono/diheme cytochrome c family protein